MSVDEATSLLSSDLKQDQLNDPDIKLIFDHVSHKIVDHFSKFTSAYAMPDQLATTVANKLLNYLCILGIPEAILSDRGTNFQSAVVSELLDLLDIHRLRTTAFHSMGN